MRMETKDNEGYTVVHAMVKRWEKVRFAEEKLKVLLCGKSPGLEWGVEGMSVLHSAAENWEIPLGVIKMLAIAMKKRGINPTRVRGGARSEERPADVFTRMRWGYLEGGKEEIGYKRRFEEDAVEILEILELSENGCRKCEDFGNKEGNQEDNEYGEADRKGHKHDEGGYFMLADNVNCVIDEEECDYDKEYEPDDEEEEENRDDQYGDIEGGENEQSNDEYEDEEQE
ncbi:hypothetical protein FPQ18DRAFT_376553 [Pyronema domesticum]|nr:hypothetical protein FPQ18DRAFT_376553 [Pyronema domesticum]